MSDAPTCSRRAVLAGSLGLGVGALVTLTGCSGDELQDGGTASTTEVADAVLQQVGSDD